MGWFSWPKWSFGEGGEEACNLVNCDLVVMVVMVAKKARMLKAQTLIMVAKVVGMMKKQRVVNGNIAKFALKMAQMAKLMKMMKAETVVKGNSARWYVVQCTYLSQTSRRDKISQNFPRQFELVYW